MRYDIYIKKKTVLVFSLYLLLVFNLSENTSYSLTFSNKQLLRILLKVSLNVPAIM